MKSQKTTPPIDPERPGNPIFRLLSLLLEWVRHILSRTTTGSGQDPQDRPPGKPSPSDRETEEDILARRLLVDVAEHLAAKLNVPPAELRLALWNMRQGRKSDNPVAAVNRVECAFTKQSPNQISLCLRVLYKAEQKSEVLELLPLEQSFSWDELPREIRSEFIRTGGKELHYLLCQQPQPSSESHD